ncbi:unnamed protein product [Toxocara canis]|uniref:Uncharacterized protein n=1 Tax=Toxocara canis TaxID=6265 RepID=A0A3P7G8R0_TOXCA|nr:unnamed protein product [Toxocara canis]
MDWIRSKLVDSDQVGSNRIRSDRIRSARIKSGQIGLDRIGSDPIGRIRSIRMRSNQIGSDEIGSDRIGSYRTESDRIESNGMSGSECIDSYRIASNRIGVSGVSALKSNRRGSDGVESIKSDPIGPGLIDSDRSSHAMDKPLRVIDENAASQRLRQQIDAINKSINTEQVAMMVCLQVAETTKESVKVETDISLSCSQRGARSVSIEQPEEEFWRLVAKAYAAKVDEMRHKNLMVIFLHLAKSCKCSTFKMIWLQLEEEIRLAESKKVKLEEARDELVAVVEDAISGDGST